MFVTGEPVPVTVGPNTMYVRPKMDFGTRNRVEDELMEIARVNGEAVIARHIGAYNTALMIHNVVRWDGPAFVGFPCTPDNIRKLDPDEPIVEAVLAKIQELNSGGPKAPANGSAGETSTTSAAG